MGNKFAVAGGPPAPARSSEQAFMQIIAYSAPPSYYDGQEPLPIIYELVLYPSETDSSRFMVELYKYSNDGDGPIHEIRSGMAGLDAFDKVCDIIAAFNAWEWTNLYLGSTPHEYGLILIQPSDKPKQKSKNHQQCRFISISPERSYMAKEKHEERCSTYLELINKIKDVLEPLGNEPLTQTRFPLCSHRHFSAFVDLQPILDSIR